MIATRDNGMGVNSSKKRDPQRTRSILIALFARAQLARRGRIDLNLDSLPRTGQALTGRPTTK